VEKSGEEYLQALYLFQRESSETIVQFVLRSDYNAQTFVTKSKAMYEQRLSCIMYDLKGNRYQQCLFRDSHCALRL
jgi:hypothetical protein